ncbi:MAG: RDD family protein [Phycisphaerae bacterium]|nr:RDD family protein [Phycisphaerae bacterium]
MLPEEFSGIDGSVYGGFWQRLGALFLDMLITAPLMFFVIYSLNAGRFVYLYVQIPSIALNIFLNIYCVKRWGGSPGKLIAQLKIVKIDGQPVGWKEAILRSLVGFSLGMLSSAAYLVVLLGMTDEQYLGMAFSERSRWMVDNMPVWAAPVRWAQNVWIWSEFIVLLCNKRKRALHDFIAGTVVIKKKYERVLEEASWEVR